MSFRLTCALLTQEYGALAEELGALESREAMLSAADAGPLCRTGDALLGSATGSETREAGGVRECGSQKRDHKGRWIIHTASNATHGA